MSEQGPEQISPEQIEEVEEIKGSKEDTLELNELESLKGDEKEFAEFIEKRHETMRALEPFLEVAREVALPELKDKIFKGLNYCLGVGYESFTSVSHDRKGLIENTVIAKHKSEMSPIEKQAEELKIQLGHLKYKI